MVLRRSQETWRGSRCRPSAVSTAISSLAGPNGRKSSSRSGAWSARRRRTTRHPTCCRWFIPTIAPVHRRTRGRDGNELRRRSISASTVRMANCACCIANLRSRSTIKAATRLSARCRTSLSASRSKWSCADEDGRAWKVAAIAERRDLATGKTERSDEFLRIWGLDAGCNGAGGSTAETLEPGSRRMIAKRPSCRLRGGAS